MNMLDSKATERERLFWPELTDGDCNAVHGGRWREEVAGPPVPIPENTVAAMTNAWWIDSCGGVETGPSVYGEGYYHQGCTS